MQPPRHKLATILSTKRCTGDRHDNYSVSTRGVLELPSKMDSARSAAIMARKFELNSNNYNERNLNRPPRDHQV
jgi:hypothetical protein